MSWLDTLGQIAQVVKDVSDVYKSTVAQVKSAKALNVTTNAIVKTSDDSPQQSTQGAAPAPAKPPLDPTQINLEFSTENKLPVLYGRGLTTGVLLDATMETNSINLWVVYGISEVTGTTISGVQSRHYLKNVYINNYKANFKADGVTLQNIEDNDGNTDDSMEDLIQVYYFYNGGTLQDFPEDYSGTAQLVQDIVPNYGEFHRFHNMVFAVVKYTYSEEDDFTRLPSVSFDVENTLVQPGDVLYDYMTNKRYGAGIPAAEIFIE